MQITRQQILAVMPRATKNVDALLPFLQQHMEECHINTRMRIVHFLVQIAVESAELTAMVENLNYGAEGLQKTFPRYFPNSRIALSYARHPEQIANRVYANRMGNGDEQSGDGYRFRGRGLIQYTGRSNYAEYTKWCGFDVVAQPGLLSQPKGAVRSACHYFESHGCNTLADTDNGTNWQSVLVNIRKKVNGGTHGIAQAQLYYQRAKMAVK